ncbi:MAG: hypothetical protein ACXWU2_11320 [Allosphingosinicella sp.]
MKTTILAIALLMSGAAMAQPTQPELDVDADVGVQPDGDLDVDADVDVNQPATDYGTTVPMHSHTTQPATNLATSMTPASGAAVQPSNTDPEEDARGIAVISDPATVPAGLNAATGAAVGGPLVDPATGAADAAGDSYPPCTASVTDNCLQTYERGRTPQ